MKPSNQPLPTVKAKKVNLLDFFIIGGIIIGAMIKQDKARKEQSKEFNEFEIVE